MLAMHKLHDTHCAMLCGMTRTVTCSHGQFPHNYESITTPVLKIDHCYTHIIDHCYTHMMDHCYSHMADHGYSHRVDHPQLQPRPLLQPRLTLSSASLIHDLGRQDSPFFHSNY